MIMCVSHFLHKVKSESSQLTLLRHPYRNEKYPLLLENGLLLLLLDVTRGPQIYVSAISESYSEDGQRTNVP